MGCALKLGLDLRADFDQDLAALGDRLEGDDGDDPMGERPGDHIGRYRLIEEIGQGAWGVVYLAEQREPVRRQVALKILKLGMDTRRMVARFEAESHALALLEHPNIAKVFDGGATATGRPYFVMELVRGIKVTDYCDQNELSTRQRLGLFIKICQAVQHAHQKGIIHRDLKPSNILITVNDGPPDPKSHRLWYRQSDRGQAGGPDGLYGTPTVHRHAGLHEPRAGDDDRPRH